MNEQTQERVFYECNQIKKNLLLCPCCKQTLVEPVFLPCFHTVCRQCLNKLEAFNFNSGQLVECPKCHKQSSKKPVHEYELNELIAEILGLSPTEVTRGKQFEDRLKEAKRKADELTELIKEANDLANNSETNISEHCAKLRNQVDLAAECLIEQINKQRDEHLKRICNFQKECVENFNNLLKVDFDKNDVYSKQIDKWLELMSRPNCLETEIDELVTNAEEVKCALILVMSDYDNKLFCKRKLQFVETVHKNLAEDFIGRLNQSNATTQIPKISYTPVVPVEEKISRRNSNSSLYNSNDDYFNRTLDNSFEF